MKLLTERVLIREVAQRWAEQYADWPHDREKQEIGRRLKAMNAETATAADVEKIIGNDSWTRIDHCDECGSENIPAAVRMAEESSASADICLPCLRKAVKLARGVGGAHARGWPADKDAEPVPMPKLPPAIVMHPQLGELFDRLAMHTYAMGYAMACADAGVLGTLAGQRQEGE